MEYEELSELSLDHSVREKCLDDICGLYSYSVLGDFYSYWNVSSIISYYSKRVMFWIFPFEFEYIL